MTTHSDEYINKILNLDFDDIVYTKFNSNNCNDETESNSSESSTCSGADLWQFICNKRDGGANPCMDTVFDVIDEYDYYGCDFFGKNKVVQLFFTGNSQYFPAIWIGDQDLNKIENLDEYPVYIFDLQNYDTNPIQPVGNFKKYITEIIDDFLNNYTTKNLKKMEHITTAKIILEKCDVLSNNMIDLGDYILKINDDE